MLVVDYDPAHGWGTPEIKPYAPISLDPMSSCFHYCPNVFEGMKVRPSFTDLSYMNIETFSFAQAYVGPDGEARLFRPEENMKRLARSAERVALPVSSLVV